MGSEPLIDNTLVESGRAGHGASLAEAVQCARPPVTTRSRYLFAVLRACPFCREMFDTREQRACVMCGVPLVALDKLPPSPEGSEEESALEDPAQVRLPLTYLRRGRGLLLALAVAGLFAFALPWIEVSLPDIVTYSGLDLAHRLGWVWGAGVAWLVLIPTVGSRRSIAQMRGARVAATFLAVIPGLTAFVLLARPPHATHGVPLRFAYGWGFFASLALSPIATIVGCLLGGRVDDIRVSRGSSQGQTLH
jgi:hypothetical protein